jgi:hypothetical protein
MLGANEATVRLPVLRWPRLSVAKSLAAKYPEVAAFWHPTRNGRLRPTDVLPGARDEPLVALRAWA